MGDSLKPYRHITVLLYGSQAGIALWRTNIVDDLTVSNIDRSRTQNGRKVDCIILSHKIEF